MRGSSTAIEGIASLTGRAVRTAGVVWTRGRRKEEPASLVFLPAPDFADAAYLLLDLGVADVFDDARAGNIYFQQTGGVDNGLACAANADVRFITHQRTGTVRARAGKIDLRSPALPGEVGADSTRPVEPQAVCLKVADFQRA